MSVGQERVSIISAMLTGNREPRVFNFYSTNKCYTTQVEKTAAETAMGTTYSGTTGTSCGSGQWWDNMTNSCKSSTNYSGTTGTWSGGTGGGGSTYVTQPTCQSAGFFLGYLVKLVF